MSNGVIPQLFAIWRKSVLLTLGAISLGAEQLENSVKVLLEPRERPDRGARVKVPVRAAKADTASSSRPVVRKAVRVAAVTRTARAGRKAAPAPWGRPRPRAARAAGRTAAQKVRVRATKVAEATASSGNLVEGQNSAN